MERYVWRHYTRHEVTAHAGTPVQGLIPCLKADHCNGVLPKTEREVMY